MGEHVPAIGSLTDAPPSGDSQWMDSLVCPKCAAPLQLGAEAVRCPSCQEAWKIVDGVPHFVDEFPYWGEITQEQMREVNRIAGSGHWKTGLLESTEPSVQRAAEMILNLERANWRWLLELPRESRVLDIGAGMGANAHALGRHYREVVALEPVLERVQFMQNRFSQEHLENVKIVRSSINSVPFADESFDLVAMNGVLEWVAAGRTGDPAEQQEAAVRNAHRLLRPGGYFYLGIENRLALGYFIGYRDPHCGLPFVTVLPRRLAHLYAKSKGQDGYRNYLYSSAGYRKLLLKAGFKRVSVYLALPSYNHPRFLIPLEKNVFSYYSKMFTSSGSGGLRTLILRFLRASGLLQYFEYSFVILAEK